MSLTVKVQNRTTGERYEFAADTQAEVDARLAEHACYGSPEEREVVTTDDLPVKIAVVHAAAYEAANAMALAAIDLNARGKYQIWLISPASSQARKSAIWSVDAWSDDLWQEYGAVRARILAGDLSARFSFSTPCPFTFWQIAAL